MTTMLCRAVFLVSCPELTYAITEKIFSSVIKLVPVVGCVILQNVALFLQTSSDVSVHALEPVLQLRIVIRITVDCIKCLEEAVT